MFLSQHTKLFVAVWVATGLLLFTGLCHSAHAQDATPRDEATTMTVVVSEADTGQPVTHASITLQFAKFGSHPLHGKPKQIVYNAKTDAQGQCKLAGITKGTIVLSITSAGHQSYGKQLQLEKDDQVFEIKLKKPQPLI